MTGRPTREGKDKTPKKEDKKMIIGALDIARIEKQ